MAEPMILPFLIPAFAFLQFSSTISTITNSSTFLVDFSVLYLSKEYEPIKVPSVIILAQISGSYPPIPAPWSTEITFFALPIFLHFLIIFALSSLNLFGVKSLFLPNPTSRTFSAAIFPYVGRRYILPNFPSNPSFAIINFEINPSNATSMAPVAPAGILTPSKRLTTSTFAGVSSKRPFDTDISIFSDI